MYEYRRLIVGEGAPYRKGETLRIEDFLESVRWFADWAIERCDALHVPRFPGAIEINAANDEELGVWQQELRLTSEELDKYIEGMRDGVYEYIRYHFVLKQMKKPPRDASAF